MSAINGVNYTKAVAVPREQSNAGEVGGVKRVLFDQYLVGALAADVLSIGSLPKGARVLEVKSINAGVGASFSVDPGEILSAAEVVTVTIGAGPADPVSAWIEYVID